MKLTDLQRTDRQANLQQSIQLDADSCVMCGMCVPHCPTYQVYRNESESPRGRISIIQAYAQKRIQPDARMLQHLDHCLGCLACEAMCPSKVSYGRLIDNAKALLAESKPQQSGLLTALLNQTRQPGGLNRYIAPLRWYKFSGMQAMAGKAFRLMGNKNLARANGLLGLAQSARLNSFYPASGKHQGDVALFTGCMGSSFDAETLNNAVKLITRLGYNLHIPEAQYCCGALHQHHGLPGEAQELRLQNQTLFGALPISHILYTANGCGAQLKQNTMPVPVMDIASFILSLPTFASTQFLPLNEPVVIHESCSSRNKLKVIGAMQKLLKAIPQLQVIEAQLPTTCCGAGSSHQLQFPELADELLQLKINKMKEAQPKYLLSDNLGCSLHFKNGLKKAGINIQVVHPVTLLARQLG